MLRISSCKAEADLDKSDWLFTFFSNLIIQYWLILYSSELIGHDIHFSYHNRPKKHSKCLKRHFFQNMWLANPNYFYIYSGRSCSFCKDNIQDILLFYAKSTKYTFLKKTGENTVSKFFNFYLFVYINTCTTVWVCAIDMLLDILWNFQSVI